MRVLAAVLLLACLGLPGTASASPGWRAVGSARELATDGERWAVWLTDTGRLHVADDRTGRTAVVPLRPRCRREEGLLAGGGRAFVECFADPASGAVTYLGVDLATRAVAEVAVPVKDTSEVDPLRIGRRWLEFDDSFNKGTSRLYLDLASGEITTVDDPSEVPDLSAPAVGRRLCRPLQRPVNPELDVAALGTVPWYGHAYRDGRWLAYAAATRYGVELRAWRCGRARSRRLSSCPGQRSICPEPQVGAGLVTWSTAGGVAVVRLRDRLEVAAVRGPRGVGRRHLAEHTRRWLYLRGGGETATVYRRPLPPAPLRRR